MIGENGNNPLELIGRTAELILRDSCCRLFSGEAKASIIAAVIQAAAIGELSTAVNRLADGLTEDAADAAVARRRLEEIRDDPGAVVGGDELDVSLNRLSRSRKDGHG